jgi:hypothetical protein
MSPRFRSPTATAVLALALMPGIAGAACPLVEKIVAGTVVDDAGKGVAGATVTATWNEKGASDVMSQTRSGEGGRFELLIQYSTYSGKSFGGTDRCEGAPPSADVSASREGARAPRERIDLGSEYGELKLVLR